MKRLYKPAVCGCILLWLCSPALRAEVEVPVTADLQADGQLAHARRLPILLVFSAQDCSYCEMLEEEFLRPMLLSGDYRDRIIIRKLLLDNGSRLTDFSGQRIDATRLSERYSITVTPTMLFLDEHGAELAQRMVGINTPELFGGYLDDCIETALLMIRNPAGLERLPGCRLQQPRRTISPAAP
jgi:thioredoxin-related protein